MVGAREGEDLCVRYLVGGTACLLQKFDVAGAQEDQAGNPPNLEIVGHRPFRQRRHPLQLVEQGAEAGGQPRAGQSLGQQRVGGVVVPQDAVAVAGEPRPHVGAHLGGVGDDRAGVVRLVGGEDAQGTGVGLLA